MLYQLSKNEQNNIQSSLVQSNFEDLEKYTSNVIEKGSRDIYVFKLLALAYVKQKKFKLSEKYFLEIVETEPDLVENYYNLAEMYREANEYKKSYKYLSICIQKESQNSKFLLSFATVGLKLKDYKNSIKALNHLLEIDAENQDAILQLSLNYLQIGKFSKALNLFLKIGETIGFTTDLYCDISLCYYYLGNLSKAKKYNKLAQNSDNAQYNLSLIDLKSGNYKKGWLGYESGLLKTRKLQKGFERFNSLPNWEPDKGFSSVVVISEQGLGDEIMFSSLLFDLEQHVTKIYLFCDIRLRKIFREKYSFVRFFSDNNSNYLNELESKIAIGSLAQYFRNSEKEFNLQKNIYFKNSKKNKTSKKLIIGISWKTANPQFSNERNIELKLLNPILKNKNYNFINLQYGDHCVEIDECNKIANRKIFLDYENDNFFNLEGLAINIKKCDYVISIDNSIAHLSGFLKTPTFLILPCVSEWRWQENRSDTPWYESIKIFRQNKKLDWIPVIRNLKNELNSLYQ